MEIMRRTPWSRIRNKTACTKNSWRLLAMGSQTGNVWKETIAVSATISISVEILHRQIRLRILSCSRMSENHREPEVPEAGVPVVECLDGQARITSKEFAITHFVKGGTLQNACFTRPRVVVGLGKSAHTHIVRLMNSRQKGPKRMMEVPLSIKVTIDHGNLVRNVLTKWNEDLLNIDHLMHGTWVPYFKTWRRRSLLSGRAPTCRSQSNVWNSKRLLHVTPQFETKILRSDIFAQVNLISVAPTLQNLRIDL